MALCNTTDTLGLFPTREPPVNWRILSKLDPGLYSPQFVSVGCAENDIGSACGLLYVPLVSSSDVIINVGLPLMLVQYTSKLGHGWDTWVSRRSRAHHGEPNSEKGVSAVACPNIAVTPSINGDRVGCGGRGSPNTRGLRCATVHSYCGAEWGIGRHARDLSNVYIHIYNRAFIENARRLPAIMGR